jgi:hypothetical protein
MSNKKRRLMSKRLLTPDFAKAAEALSLPGEAGRAIPGVKQVQQARKQAAVQGEPQVPHNTDRLEVSTYTTRTSGTYLLYEAERWVRLRLTLETAGPVDVGTRDNIEPVLSGKGLSLPTNVELQFSMSKGDKLYVAATSINRIRVIVEPIPWGEQIANMIGSLLRRG